MFADRHEVELWLDASERLADRTCGDDPCDGAIAVQDLDVGPAFDGAQMFGEMVVEFRNPDAFHGYIWPDLRLNVKLSPGRTYSRPASS